MANFNIPEEPKYNNVMRQLEPTDPGHANTFNPLFAQLLINEEYLFKQMGKGLSCKVLGGENLSPEATVIDEQAQFAVVTKTQAQEEVPVFAQEIPGLFLGSYSVVIRCKCSDNSGSDGILKITAAYVSDQGETVLKEVRVKPEMFAEADKYHSFSFLVEYCGVNAEQAKMKLTAVLLPGEGPKSVSVDYVLVNYAYGAITSLA